MGTTITNLWAINLQVSTGIEMLGSVVIWDNSWHRDSPILLLKTDVSWKKEHPNRKLSWIPDYMRLGIGNFKYDYITSYSGVQDTGTAIAKIYSGDIGYNLYYSPSKYTFNSKQITLGVSVFYIPLMRKKLLLIGPFTRSEFQFGLLKRTTLRLQWSIGFLYCNKSKKITPSIFGGVSTFFFLN